MNKALKLTALVLGWLLIIILTLFAFVAWLGLLAAIAV